MRRLLQTTACALILGFTGCGTQIGNPGGGGKDIMPWYKDPDALFAINSQVFLQTVDAISAGDYAYSKSSKRVITDSRCDRTAVQAISEGRHAVKDRLGDWSATTDLSLNRSYTDRWEHEGIAASCDPQLSLVNFSLLELSQGSLNLESEIRENSTRAIAMKQQVSGASLWASFATESAGYRRLHFKGTAAGSDLILQTEVRSYLDSTIRFRRDPLRKERILRLVDSGRTALQLSIVRDALGDIQSQKIPDGRLRVEIQEGGHVELLFQDIVFQSASGCVPRAGSYRFRAYSADGLERASYEIHFPIAVDLFMTSTKDASQLPLLPFACTIKES